jgi:hypothetical protein
VFRHHGRGARMNRIGRSIVYLLFGVAPAGFCTMLLAPFFFSGPLRLLLLIPLSGTCGLVIAMTTPFPAPPKRYWLMTGLLVCGLALVFPLGIATVYSMFSHGINIREWRLVVLVFLAFICPSACALHAIWRGRCAP